MKDLIAGMVIEIADDLCAYSNLAKIYEGNLQRLFALHGESLQIFEEEWIDLPMPDLHRILLEKLDVQMEVLEAEIQIASENLQRARKWIDDKKENANVKR